MSDFVDGLRAYKPSEKAPDFVVANLLANAKELSEWLSENADAEGFVRFTIKESKGGKYYCQKDDYKPSAKQESAHPSDAAGSGGIDPSDIPF